jgi:hypothetical protein
MVYITEIDWAGREHLVPDAAVSDIPNPSNSRQRGKLYVQEETPNVCWQMVLDLAIDPFFCSFLGGQSQFIFARGARPFKCREFRLLYSHEIVDLRSQTRLFRTLCPCIQAVTAW